MLIVLNEVTARQQTVLVSVKGTLLVSGGRQRQKVDIETRRQWYKQIKTTDMSEIYANVVYRTVPNLDTGGFIKGAKKCKTVNGARV